MLLFIDQFGPIIGSLVAILMVALAILASGYSHIQVTRGWVNLLKEEGAPPEKIHDFIVKRGKRRPRRGRPK